MYKQNESGNVDWMSLAAKMFMSKLTETSPVKQHGKQTGHPSPHPSQKLQPEYRTKTRTATSPRVSTQLPPDVVASIRQFEEARQKLLRKLVQYQMQLMAMKIPRVGLSRQPLPTCKTISPKGKSLQNGTSSVKNRKQTCTINSKSGQQTLTKKWKKVQNPVQIVKNPIIRQSQMQNPKKQMKKSSQRKMEASQASRIRLHKDKSNEQPCQSDGSCARNVSYSTDISSFKQLKSYNDFNFDYASGENMFLKDSLINALNLMGKNSGSTSKLPQRRVSKLNQEISSVSTSETTTDEETSLGKYL